MISICLSADACQSLLDHYRRAIDPGVRLRVHIPLLPGAGHQWAIRPLTVPGILHVDPRGGTGTGLGARYHQ